MENGLNPRRIGILLGLLVAVGVGIYFYQQVTDRQDQEGKSELYRIQKISEDELAALPESDRLPGAKLDIAAKLPKTVTELNGMLAAKKVPARVLYEAAMKLGNLYLDHGDAAKATESFKLMPTFGKTSFQKAAALFLLGTAQERSGMAKEAIESFQQGLSKDVEGLKGEFLLGLIRNFVKTNEVEKAKPLLEKLRKELPGSKALEVGESLIGK